MITSEQRRIALDIKQKILSEESDKIVDKILEEIIEFEEDAVNKEIAKRATRKQMQQRFNI